MRWRRAFWLWLALFVLALPLLWWSITSQRQQFVEVGEWGDHAYLFGINAVEQSASESYRWTTGDTTLALPNLSASQRLLSFRAHAWRPDGVNIPALAMSAGQPLGEIQLTAEPRIYRVLLPEPGGNLFTNVGLNTSAYYALGDGRPLGMAVDWLSLRALGASAPAPGQFAGQALALALLLGVAAASGLPGRWPLAAGLVLVACLLGANARQPMWVAAGLPGLLASLACTLALLAARRPFVRWCAPWLSTAQAKLALGLLAFALLVRLAGAVHPLFDMHDLPYHTDWLGTTANGELYFYSTPSELQNRQTFNPPAGYLLLAPLALWLPPRLAVQVGVAVLDAAACLLVLCLARSLGMNGRGGVLALAASVALPMSVTMLWWGFATNALAQPVWLLLACLLVQAAEHPGWRPAALLAVAASLALLTHVGALALVVATLGLTCLLSFWWLPRASQLTLAAGLGLAAVLAALLYFSAVAPTVLGQSARAVTTTADPANQTPLELRWQLFGTGVWRGFTPWLLVLLPVGAPQLWRQARAVWFRRALLLGWLGAVVAAVAAYFVLGVVARDLYFAAPLVCLAAGAALDALWLWRGGRWLALLILALVAWQGLALWFGGVLERVKLSALPLTR